MGKESIVQLQGMSFEAWNFIKGIGKRTWIRSGLQTGNEYFLSMNFNTEQLCELLLAFGELSVFEKRLPEFQDSKIKILDLETFLKEPLDSYSEYEQQNSDEEFEVVIKNFEELQNKKNVDKANPDLIEELIKEEKNEIKNYRKRLHDYDLLLRCILFKVMESLEKEFFVNSEATIERLCDKELLLKFKKIIYVVEWQVSDLKPEMRLSLEAIRNLVANFENFEGKDLVKKNKETQEMQLKKNDGEKTKKEF